MTSKPRAPAGLGPRGRAVWRSVVADYEFRADELAVLEELARTVDLCGTLARAVDAAPLVVDGSTGQPRANPLLTELRGHRLVLARLVGSLGLADVPDEAGDGAATPTPRQARARRAAEARWGRAGGARRGAS